MHLAHLTLVAPSGFQIVSMEVLEGLTSAVDCQGDDGTISITFKSQEVLDFALKEWAWINEKTEEEFILITNHDGCGPDAERQAYMWGAPTEPFSPSTEIPARDGC